MKTANINDAFIQNMENCVIIDDCTIDNDASLLFSNPVQIIIANKPHEISNALEEIDIARSFGKYVAGYFAYEIGHFLENNFNIDYYEKIPLLWFGVYDAPQKINIDSINSQNDFMLTKPKYSINFVQYNQSFAKIHNHITQGAIYQANLTFKANYHFEGAALSFYLQARKQQRGKYGAYIDIKEAKILSFSPELFFEIKGNEIFTKPMKGTIKRGKSTLEDLNNKNFLAQDEKNRAENLMIVDLMRNDISRIAINNSVKTPKLFEIETYPTLHQMTSQVIGQIPQGLKCEKLLKAIFPSGSIIGAPKISAMNIINDNETAPRGIYCGAIGFFHENNARFNVAIRSPVIYPDGQMQMGIGSGVVYDSNAKDEYKEAKLKAKFINKLTQDFGLIETMRFEKAFGLMRLNAHLQRLQTAAIAIGFEFDIGEIKEQVLQYAANIEFDIARLRIVLSQNGKIEISHSMHINANMASKIILSNKIMNAKNPWLYYKTTNRQFYDNEWQKYSLQGFDEVIFQNQEGQITEGSRTNIFIDMGDSKLLTPPINCGLLNGILRESLLKSGQTIEAIVTPKMLRAAKNIYIGNALRGLMTVTLEQ